jgi:hypothetical protein
MQHSQLVTRTWLEHCKGVNLNATQECGSLKQMSLHEACGGAEFCSSLNGNQG